MTMLHLARVASTALGLSLLSPSPVAEQACPPSGPPGGGTAAREGGNASGAYGREAPPSPRGARATGVERPVAPRVPAPPSGPSLRGRHTMTGELVALDRARGTLVVRTDEHGDLGLHFPPPSLAGMQIGDRMTVLLAFHTVAAEGAAVERRAGRAEERALGGAPPAERRAGSPSPGGPERR